MFNENEKPFVISFEYEPPAQQIQNSNQNFSDIQKTEKEKFEYALQFVTTDICSTFEEWTSCAMAINKEFGDAGLEYFRSISKYYSGRQSDAEVDAKYKHCKNARNYSIGTVYHLIEKAGIIIDWKSFYPKKTKAEKAEIIKAKKKELLRKFDDLENSYYFQMHGFYSIPEMEELLKENGIEDKKFKLDYNKENLVLIRTRDGVELSINQVFADNWEVFTKICTEKHFPLYQDVLNDKFSFNFTAEEMTAWLTTYPQTIFRNFEYNRAAHAITPAVNNAEHFDINRTVKSKVENLFESSLNIQEKKLKEFKPKMETALLTFSENFEMQCEGITIKQNNGWIDEVLIIGKKYLSEHSGSDLIEYWISALYSIFTMSEDDCVSIISFIINSIRVRLYGDSQSMRAMIITGDSGIGKDSFLQGVLTGLNYRKADKYILRGSLRGATGFSVANEKDMKGIMYNYISDDLSSANNSTNLDTITSPRLPLEIKGSTQKYIPKRFNSVITNNDPHVIFGKDKDPNAIARRFNFCEIKYAKGCNSTDYRAFYSHYDGKFDNFWAGFFTFCFELEKFNNEVVMLSDRARNHTLENLNKLFYAGNDDNRILDLLTGFYNREIDKIQDNSLIEKNEFVKDIKSKYVLIIKSISDYWKIDNKFSADVIRKTVSAHIKNAKFNGTYKEYGISKHAALIIPCEFFNNDPVTDIFDDGFEQIKIDLIDNFKKYL